MKKLKHSKTFWFNFVTGIIAVSTYIDPELLSILGLNELVVMKLTGAIVAVGNIYLRSITKTGISIKK